jgi:hypothetical protein
VVVDHLAGDPGEPRRELGRGLVASLLGEQRVAADIGDQEGPDPGPLVYGFAVPITAHPDPPIRCAIMGRGRSSF